jgi:inorganic triphosphatase YgiF
MTYKGDKQQVGEAVSRLEDEVELPAAFAAVWSPHGPLPTADPADPLQRALAISGSAALLPTAVIDTTRRTHVFTGNGAEIEVAVDRSRATRGSDGRVVDFGELEIELHAGAPEQLTALCGALQYAVPGLKPSQKTKLSRALD